MASVPKGAYRNLMRTDGGPFLALNPVDEFGLTAQAGHKPDAVDVYFSDITVPPGTPVGSHPWLLIMTVEEERLTFYPVIQRSDNPDYGLPVYESIHRLIVNRRVDDVYRLPENQADLENLLADLPAGFYQDWRYGVGVKWEYRSIITTIGRMPEIDTVMFHSSPRTPSKDYATPPFYVLGMATFEHLCRQIAGITRRHQESGRREKRQLCYNRLLHDVDPVTFPRERLALPPGTLSELSPEVGGLALSKNDQKAVVRLVKEHSESLAKEAPTELLRLKESIELVSLARLIERCTELLDPSTSETKWQAFLSSNPFILSMAFHYPVVRIGDVPYVGGKSHRGSGGSHSDFLMAAAATNNLALVEIKAPGTPLLGKPYREIYPPSTHLSGAVSQVVAQRAELQLNFRSSVGVQLDRKGYRTHAIACVVIVGLTPSTEEQTQGFEQYRHSLHGVQVVTFDEVVDKLKALYGLLAGGTPSAVSRDPEPPF